MKKIAILQSNYIPWKGYFDLIASVDEFILYDDMQYTKNDWRNRNKIKTPKGVEWISVPVGQDIHRRIRDVQLNDHSWQIKHWRTLESNYGRARYFDLIADWLAPLYLNEKYFSLSQLNRRFIEEICHFLRIRTSIANSWDYVLTEGKTQRLVDLCIQAGAGEYFSGPSAFAYLDESLFEKNNIKLKSFGYDNYPTYPQLWGEFDHFVSIVDLLFNCGADAPLFMRHIKR